MMIPTLAQLYDAHHARHCHDLDFWRKLAGRANGPLLELGCGTGRVLLPLLHAGFQVAGLDNDRDMLYFLRQRLAELPAENAGRAELIQADMCDFALERRFGLVLLPCNTLSTLEAAARGRMLSCVAAHLKAGGLFAASMPNPQALCELPHRGKEEEEDRFNMPDGGSVRVSSSWLRSRKQFEVRWHYDYTPPGGAGQRQSMSARHTLDRLEQYLGEIRAAGLELQALYGGFAGEDFNQDADEVVLLAERA